MCQKRDVRNFPLTAGPSGGRGKNQKMKTRVRDIIPDHLGLIYEFEGQGFPSRMVTDPNCHTPVMSDQLQFLNSLFFSKENL